jgi:hypothetical protein
MQYLQGAETACQIKQQPTSLLVRETWFLVMGPPASVHSASEITQPLVSQLSNLPQVGNSVLKIFPIKHRPKMYIKFLKNRMKFCRG